MPTDLTRVERSLPWEALADRIVPDFLGMHTNTIALTTSQRGIKVPEIGSGVWGRATQDSPPPRLVYAQRRDLIPLFFFTRGGHGARRGPKVKYPLSGRLGGRGETAALGASSTLQRPLGRERFLGGRGGGLAEEKAGWGIEAGGGPLPLLRTAPLADSSAGSASFSLAPVQPEHQGARARSSPLRVSLVPFIPEGGV